jgi:peptidoglycan/LPS O-acetylase OafA/YrhL
LLYYVVRYPETLPGRILNSRILSRIGILSYALYLVHYMVILEVSMHIMHGLTFWGGVVSFLIALAIAEWIHVFVENPTEKIRLRLKRTSPVGTQKAVPRVDAGHEVTVANESAL